MLLCDEKKEYIQSGWAVRCCDLCSFLTLFIYVLCQTAERIVTVQTALRPASVRTGHGATDTAAAVAACTAGSDCPVKKVQ